MVLSLYELAWKPAAAMIRRSDPERAHASTLALLRRADAVAPISSLARLANRATFQPRPVRVGGVELPHPIIVAAGLVKGDGYTDEAEALRAVRARRDIIPGWRSLPALVGAVEYGSFTRHPRLGNSGRVLWRDSAARSMQNRIGLRNPGARAAAVHLAGNAAALPPVWGLNFAVSPAVADPEQSAMEVTEAAAFFTEAFAGLGAGPSWLTLNLSCPNTEDDPRGTQSAELAEMLCSALAGSISMPLWVKVGPDLSDEQLAGLVAAFSATGVRAVVATNTWAQPLPSGGGSTGVSGAGGGSAGVSGAGLRSRALDTVTRLGQVIDSTGAPLDVVACGGILAGSDLLEFQAAGAQAAMIYSALVFRGPLAAALILREAERGGRYA